MLPGRGLLGKPRLPHEVVEANCLCLEDFEILIRHCDDPRKVVIALAAIRLNVGDARVLAEIHVEDFALQVSSPGLNEPFKVARQYAKNIGRDLDVKTGNGRIEGKLTNVSEAGITIINRTKERIEGRKAKEWVERVHEIPFSEIVETKIVISFK